MTAQNSHQPCFNCGRTDEEIPMILWTYRERPLPVCCQCIPTLIHNWEQVITLLDARPAGVNHE